MKILGKNFYSKNGEESTWDKPKDVKNHENSVKKQYNKNNSKMKKGEIKTVKTMKKSTLSNKNIADLKKIKM